MGIKTVAVCDVEQTYVSKFIRQASDRALTGLRFIGISNPEKLYETSGVNVWILGKGFWEKRFVSVNRDKCILLCGDEIPADMGNGPCVFKYAPTKSILREIYKTKVWESNIPDDETTGAMRGRLIFVHAPTGCAENSCYALAIADALGEESKTIFLSLAGNRDFSTAFGMEPSETISDIIIRLKRGDTGVDLRRYVGTLGNIHVLYPVRQAHQISEFGYDELRLLVDFIRRQKSFDNIVIQSELMSLGLMRSFLESDIRILISGRGALEELARRMFCSEIAMFGEGASADCLVMYRTFKTFDEKCGEALRTEIINGQYKGVARRFLAENGGGFYKG